MRHPHGLFGWVDLAVRDTAAAVTFYNAVFGWDAVGVAAGYLMFAKDGKNVAGLGEFSPEDGSPPVWSSYVIVADVDAIAARATELGGQVLVPPMDILDAGRMTYLADPTGAMIGFWQAGTHQGADAFNEPGFLSWNGLATRDLDAAAGFYAGLLPWTLDERDLGGGARYATITLDGRLNGGMFTMGPDVPAEVPPHWVVYFATADADATVAAVSAHGGKVRTPVADSPFGRVASVGDPQGARFRVVEPNPQD